MEQINNNMFCIEFNFIMLSIKYLFIEQIFSFTFPLDLNLYVNNILLVGNFYVRKLI